MKICFMSKVVLRESLLYEKACFMWKLALQSLLYVKACLELSYYFHIQNRKLFGTGPKTFSNGTRNFFVAWFIRDQQLFSFFLAGRQRDHQLFLPWKTTGPKAFFRQKSHISRSRFPINFDRSLTSLFEKVLFSDSNINGKKCFNFGIERQEPLMASQKRAVLV